MAGFPPEGTEVAGAGGGGWNSRVRTPPQPMRLPRERLVDETLVP